MEKIFKFTVLVLGIGFAILFAIFIIPPFLQNPDIIGAFAAGFVNPYSTGYSLDTIFCWMILTVWISYEAKTKDIRYGWIAAIVGVVPGVATGFALYLLIRMRQEVQSNFRKQSQ